MNHPAGPVLGHPWGRWTGRLATAAVLGLLLGALGAGAAPRADAATGVRIDLTALTPAVATSGSTLEAAGTVDNAGAVVRDARVRLRLSDTRLNSRAELAAYADGTLPSRDGQVVVEEPLGDLAHGSRTSFDLQQALDQVSALSGFGVYALGVEVVGSRGGGTSRLALTRTQLPWVPASPDFRPTGFSWVWPLVGRPVRLADGTFADDSLAKDLAPGGRLTRLLDAGSRLAQGAAVTWAVDPDLVETVADMADGYPVVAANGGTVAGGGQVLAQRWLAALRAATAGAPVLALPYADPDLVAVVHGGGPSDLALSTTVGSQSLSALLPQATLQGGMSWPVDGFLDKDTLAGLARNGTTSVVLDGRALPSTIDLSYTPAGRARLASGAGRPVAALLADPGLADLLGRGRLRHTALVSAQRVVAETAMITSELPSTGTSRTIVAMPPRRWDPSQAFLDRLVTLAAAPWQAPVGLATLAATPPPEVDRGRLTYPRSAARAQLPAAYLTGVTELASEINNFAAILTDRTQLVPGLETSVRRLESSAWRGREEERNIRKDREGTYLDGLRRSVHVQLGSFTFGSRSGTFPVTLVNELPQAVQVVLRLAPQTPRLRLSDPPALIAIGPKQKRQVEVKASAVAGGPVVVDATLHTPGGALYSQPVQLQVNITQIGTVALIITVGAAVVLFLAAGIRVAGRLRAARRSAPDPDAPGGDQPDDSDRPDGSDRPADVPA